MSNIETFQAIADLTLEYCRKHCRNLGSCCEPAYCEMAKEYAAEQGVVLEETGREIFFLREDGQCVVPPYLRPMCSLHQCDINGLGVFKHDFGLTEKYFGLREALEE